MREVLEYNVCRDGLQHSFFRDQLIATIAKTEGTTMSKARKFYVIASTLCATVAASVAHAEANKVVIGDIDDMSGVYADIICSASIWMGTATIRMAISAVALRG